METLIRIMLTIFLYFTGQPSPVSAFDDIAKESNETRCSYEKDLREERPRSIKEQRKMAGLSRDEEIAVKIITLCKTLKSPCISF